MKNRLTLLYKNFIREKISNKYLIHKKHYLVLGDGFINGYYLAIISSNNEYINLQNYYLIIENCKTPKIIELKQTELASQYVKLDKPYLLKNMPANILYYLAKQGLCTTINNAIKKESNPYLLHRLVMCLYHNIISLTVHHNNKNPQVNHINNLTPLEDTLHKRLDRIENSEKYTDKTNFYNQKFKTKYFKPSKNTLANRDKNILTILHKLYLKLPVKNIICSKYKQTKVYEIKRHYFYLVEFINYMKSLIDKESAPLYEKHHKNWKHILDFEMCNTEKLLINKEFKQLFKDIFIYKEKMT